ncbi:hypothetical protein C5167_002036 [Papaver somniferum]|uniref:dolichol kinase n=1 Tax=Papaver somniferum TaxID=3469 RepID=A0A4Y7KY67_PAPSO|nr:hypothetical protein C5167_002036 [Papaver somniferum]
MFSPALIFQYSFLDLAFGAALAVFLILEIVRFFGEPLHNHNLCSQTIATLSSLLSVSYSSHFSLLLGCALPKRLSTDFNDRPLAPFAGILSLGIGDTMAGWIQVWGSQVEQNRLNKDILLFFLSEKTIEGIVAGITSVLAACSVLFPLLASTGFIISQLNTFLMSPELLSEQYGFKRTKTIEGTAAGITFVLAACSVLLPLLPSTGFIISQHWISLLIAVTASGLLEVYTAQLDNAFIPLVFYSLLCL